MPPQRVDSMKGKSLSNDKAELPLIFYKIRTVRTNAERRSWQRRARIALAARSDLTEAERHEVAAVWSKPDPERYDSPALRKLLGQAPKPERWQTKDAHAVTRAAFDRRTGERRNKQPKQATECKRLNFGSAANEDTWPRPVQLVLIS